ncbi:MAG: peptide chain release factor N(5)-glutamine methyltransferase [Sporomusaceae bacterium]|jgi:release factor glutamine methyltransferase|nr:peptide chain release factor N(5)-glutamine methyltransferase [Sporomusaceae bacterium]
MAADWTIGKILNWTRQYFEEKGIENPRLDAEVLLAHILKKDRLYLYTHFDQPLDPSELSEFRNLVRARANRLPVAYALGFKEFMGLNLQVDPNVLIPRPDTEILVETACNLLKEVKEPQILDLGTGSGAIIVSLLAALKDAAGVAVDISPAALKIAQANAARHNVLTRLEFACGDLFGPLAEISPAPRAFDAILANPPYIPAADLASLSPEVRQEPQLALNGGADGLDFYRRLLRDAKDYLHADGFLAVEIGIGQAPQIEALSKDTGFVLQQIVKDYSNIDRVLVYKNRV